MKALSSPAKLGIDPSFKRTGLCVYRPESGFRFTRLDNEMPPKRFTDLYQLSKHIATVLKRTVIQINATVVVIESPPPVSQFSAGMYQLVTSICMRLQEIDAVRILVTDRPQVGRYLFKQQKWPKSNSTRIAKPYFNQKGRLCADEADAFIMLLPLLPKRYHQETGVLRLPEYTELRP